jgi:hypothetical protein
MRGSLAGHPKALAERRHASHAWEFSEYWMKFARSQTCSTNRGTLQHAPPSPV